MVSWDLRAGAVGTGCPGSDHMGPNGPQTLSVNVWLRFLGKYIYVSICIRNLRPFWLKAYGRRFFLCGRSHFWFKP